MRRRIVVRQERFSGAAGGEEMTADPLVAAMTPDTPVPRFERFRPAYSSGTVALSTRGSSFTSYSAACYSPFMNPPTKAIKIAIPHRVSRQEATQRLQSGFADFRKE